MFDKLINFLIELKDDVIPFRVVNELESLMNQLVMD
jgi:hypothetical protein